MRIYLLFVLVCLSACAPPVDRAKPPDLRLGEDPCDHCKMIINEARFAASYFDADETPRRFDDIGCLLSYTEAASQTPDRVWVHEYEGDRWLNSHEATFVLSRQIHTAMGSGIVALASGDQASELAATHGGKVATFEELVAGRRPE